MDFFYQRSQGPYLTTSPSRAYRIYQQRTSPFRGLGLVQQNLFRGAGMTWGPNSNIFYEDTEQGGDYRVDRSQLET